MRYDAAVRRDEPPQVWQNGRGRRIAIHGRRQAGPAEERPPGPARVVLDELSHLIDRLDAVHVALICRRAPGEEPVAAEQETVASWMLVHRPPQHHAQLESGSLPGHPDDMPTEAIVERLQLLVAVGAGRQRDAPIRVKMIDVVERQE